MLEGMAEDLGYVPDILLRLSPGVEPNTHKYIATGIVDTKFGFPLSGGGEAVRGPVLGANRALASDKPATGLVGGLSKSARGKSDGSYWSSSAVSSEADN